ncbi:MAG: RsmB/NOP family class I SAM-dependent RNA methyltransferase, partial [Prevotella sp.]|nr:RsmB/NOP family class I SAM-dependent RNA methyltransferase [Prevotella sp.]
MLPNDFIESTRATFGEALWEQYLGAFDSGAPVSIRLNRRKATDGIAGNGHERVAWCDDGIYLGERPQFTFDPLLHAGAYYVQEASSMFLHHVMKHVLGKEPLLMIDMCAAPGGKSTLACSLLPEGSMIVSNEPVAQRASILSENMKKWGMPNVVVTNNYPRDIRKTGIMADIVLCDVPCSGEGMFRKDEATIGEWSMKNVEKCSAMQREIVSEAWQCLRQGGIMIYSTCTFNTRENEENVRWISESMDGEI